MYIKPSYISLYSCRGESASRLRIQVTLGGGSSSKRSDKFSGWNMQDRTNFGRRSEA